MLPRVSQGFNKFVCTLEHAGVSFKGIKYNVYFQLDKVTRSK